MRIDQYETRGGIRVTRTVDDIPIANAIEQATALLRSFCRGMELTDGDERADDRAALTASALLAIAEQLRRIADAQEATSHAGRR